jgi:hypothetical protein
MELGGINLNSVLIVAGWLVGGLIVVVGMRAQMKHLAVEISLLRGALLTITGRIDQNSIDIAFLRGRDAGRHEALEGVHP